MGRLLSFQFGRGFAEIRVPDLQAVAEHWTKNNMDIEDILYQSPAGPIPIKDVFYGLSKGSQFMAHKTGFTLKSLAQVLLKSGFHTIKLQHDSYEVRAVAFKNEPKLDTLNLLKLT